MRRTSRPLGSFPATSLVHQVVGHDGLVAHVGEVELRPLLKGAAHAGDLLVGVDPARLAVLDSHTGMIPHLTLAGDR